MCNPAAVIGMVLSVAMTAYQMSEANEAQNEAEARARKAAAQQLELESERQKQLNKEQAQKHKVDTMERQRAGKRERGSIMAAAAEAGAFGNLTLTELANSMQDESYDIGILDANRRNQQSQLELQGKAATFNAQSMIDANKARNPSSFATALTIGGAGIQGGMSGYSAGQNIGMSNFGGGGGGGVPSTSPRQQQLGV